MPTSLLFRLLGPAALPICMVAFNAVRFALIWMAERRIADTGLVYIFLYASTIKPARDGDLTPFTHVFLSRR